MMRHWGYLVGGPGAAPLTRPQGRVGLSRLQFLVVRGVALAVVTVVAMAAAVAPTIRPVAIPTPALAQ
jgi:hypothetical protein